MDIDRTGDAEAARLTDVPKGAAEERPAEAAADVLAGPDAGALVIRGSAYRTAGYVLGVGLGLAAIPLLVRHLGVGDFGRYITATSIVAVVAAVTDAGLTSVALREFATRDEARARALMGQLLGLRLALTLSGLALAALFMAVAGYDGTLIVGTMLAGLGLVVTVSQSTLAVPLAAALRLGAVTAIDLVRNATATALIVALVVAGAGLLAFLATPIAAALVALALTYALVRAKVPVTPAFAAGESLALLRQAFVFAVASAIGILYYRVAVILLSRLSDEEQTGYFSASFRIVEGLAMIAALLATSVFPVLARAALDDRARLSYALQRTFEVSLIVGVWISLVTVIAAEPAIDLFAGQDFEPSIDVLRIQGIGIAATFLVATWGYGLLALHRHAALLLGNAVALTIVIVGIAGLLDRGATGAALATVAAEFVLAATYVLQLVRGDPALRPGLRIVPRVALALALGVGAALLPGVGPILGAIAASAVYLGILVATRAIPPEVTAAFRRPRPSA